MTLQIIVSLVVLVWAIPMFAVVLMTGLLGR